MGAKMKQSIIFDFFKSTTPSNGKSPKKNTAEAVPALQQSVMTSAPTQLDPPQSFVLKQPMLVGTKNKASSTDKDQKQPKNLPLFEKGRPGGVCDKSVSIENGE